MGIQINGNTDTITAIDGALTVSGAELSAVTNLNATGIVTATGFVGNITGNVNSSGVSTIATLNVTQSNPTRLNVSGISTFAAGSVSAPSITPTGDSNTGIFFPAADTIAFAEGGVEALRIDSSANIGIGTANPSQRLEVVGGEIKAGRVDSTNEGGQVSFGRATDNATGWYIDVYGNTSTPSLRFVDVSNSAVRATIDGSGRLTLPYQPFVAGGAASGSISGNNNHIWAKSGYVFSNRGNHWDASTGRFTAPVDGVYYVSAGIRYSGVPVTPSYVYIYFSASYQTASGQPILLWSTQTEGGGTYRPRILTSLMYMRANDYVEPRLYVTNGTISLDEGSLGQNDSFLNIYLLG
jgi:hypothetical protein